MIKQQEFNALEERVASIEHFSDRTLPIMLNLTISDYFQEFLSYPDQLKLIEFEN